MWIDYRLNDDRYANDVYEGETLTMDKQTKVVLQTERIADEDYYYRPEVLGGSLEFYVEMHNLNPGCTAGVYLVPVNDDCDIESAISASNPKCPSISVM